MKGTLFSADFIEDSNGNLRLLELNTDTGISDAAINQINFSGLIDILSGSNITELHTISKEFQSNIVNHLSQSIIESASFITTFENIVEESTTIYPTRIDDADNRFILRMAYDESALFDSEYAKNVLGSFDLFTQNNDTGSVAEFYVSSSLMTFDGLPREFNNNNIPDVVVKDISNNDLDGLSFYKIGKSTESDVDRYNEFFENIGTDKLVVKFYDNTELTKVESVRSYNIIYGSDLDILNIGNFISEGLFEKPTTINYDDTIIANETNKKHYYELTTTYPKFSNVYNWGGIFEEEEILKIDGTSVLISEAEVGDEFKSYFISGSPDTDVASEFMKWSHPGSELPSGSFETGSILINKIEQPLSHNLVFHLTMEDGSDFRASGGSHLLIHDVNLNCIRYETISEIDGNIHKLINLTGGTINISAIEIDIMDGDYSTYVIDMESTDTYFLSNGEISVKIVTHNCFPAGTKITLSDKSQKNIEDLTIEDKLLSWDESKNELCDGTIGSIQKKIEHFVIKMTTSDNTEIKTTPLHRFFVKERGWVTAQDICIGDVLFTQDGNDVIVTQKEDIIGEIEVYHILNVKNHHTYFAEKLLVHNFKYGGGCFVEGTKVSLKDGLTKNIEDIMEGDEVLTLNEISQIVEVKKVTQLIKPINKDLVKYHLTNNTTLICTFDHPIYVNGLMLSSFIPEWTNFKYNLEKTVNKIKVGDMLRLDSGSDVAIKEIEIIPSEEVQTYTITVEDNHNFFANNVLVHNKL